jgi:hypothetical protein
MKRLHGKKEKQLSLPGVATSSLLIQYFLTNPNKNVLNLTTDIYIYLISQSGN